MNTVVLMGRLTKDPDIRVTQGDNPTTVARYSLAVDRRYRKEWEQSADFITMVSFGKTAEFIEKYTHKGTKLCIRGRIQTGSYTDKDGRKIYTTDVVGEEVEFAESKKSQESSQGEAPQEEKTDDDGFINVPDGIDSELPFA